MNFDKEWISWLKTATHSELLYEFDDFPAFYAVIDNQIDLIGLIEIENFFLISDIFGMAPVALCVIFERYEMLKRLLESTDSWNANYDIARYGTEKTLWAWKPAGGVSERELGLAIANPDDAVLSYFLTLFDFESIERWCLLKLVPVAIRHKSLLFLRHFTKSARFGQFSDQLSNFFCEAAMYGDEEMVALFLQNGADKDEKGIDRWYPVQCACCNENEKVLQILLIIGTKPQDRMYSIAADNPNEKVTQILVRAGISQDEEAAFGITPLVRAAELGAVGTVRILLEASGSRNCEELSNAVFSAARNKNAQVMLVLLDAGAKILDRKLLLLEAADSGNEEVFFMLLDSANVTEEKWSTAYMLDLLSRALARKSTKIFRFIYNYIHNHKYSNVFYEHLYHCQLGIRISSEIMVELFARGMHEMPVLYEYYTDNYDGLFRLLTLISGGYVFRDKSLLSVFSQLTRDSKSRTFVAFAKAMDEDKCDTFNPYIGWARKKVESQQLVLLRARAMHVCTVLFRLSALEQCEILANIFAPMPCLVPFHKIWNIVRFIKHFKN